MKYYYLCLQGRPTEATLEIVARQFGEVDAKEFVPGAEILLETENTESGNDSDDSDGEWENVSHSEDENVDDEDLDDVEGEDNDDEEEEEDDVDDEENESDAEDLNETDQSISTQTSLTTNPTLPKKKVVSKKEQLAEKKEKAAQVSSMRILSDEDFKRIEIAQLNKQMTSAKRKRTAEPDATSR